MHNNFFFKKKIRVNKNKYNQRKIFNESFILCFYQSNFSELFFKKIKSTKTTTKTKIKVEKTKIQNTKNEK